MKSKYKKLIAILLISSMLYVTIPSPAKADYWGASLMAEIWKQTTEQMVKSIYDTILANLKIAAIRIIQARLFSLLGQTGGSQAPGVIGYIISDWKMFIYNSAMRYSTQVTNDFFRSISAGSTSAMQKLIINPAQRAVNNEILKPDLQNYCPGGDPAKAFDPGTRNNWMCWRGAAMPQNDLAFLTLQAQSLKKAAYEQETEARKAEGVAGQGIKSKEEQKTANQGPVREATTSTGKKVSVPAGSDYRGENITTPGSIISNITNEINMMPVRMLTLARSIPEVVTSMVNQMIAQLIQQGVTQIINGTSGGMNMGSITNSSMSQMQSLIQSGVRQMASPNMFFGGGVRY